MTTMTTSSSTTTKTTDPPMGSCPIPNHPGYVASLDGAIWSNWTTTGKGKGYKLGSQWHKLKGSPRRSDGRLRYAVRGNAGQYRRVYGSVLVLEAFVGQRPAGMEACHNNGKCTDDSKGNLRWDTPESNKADTLIHGTRARGIRIHTAKLNEASVRNIRELSGNGMANTHLARMFGVSTTMIIHVKKRRHWKHV